MLAVPQLLASDFDGTMFLTAEQGPNILGVNEAYAVAIEEHIGEDASHSFIHNGGHQHRDAAEIVMSLVDGVDLQTTKKLTTGVIHTKLDILLDQIGKPLGDGERWPRPTDGFIEFWRAIDSVNDQSKLSVVTGIVSAGYTEFQQDTFDLYDLTHPDIFMTTDTLEAMALNVPLELRVKPSPFMLQVIQVFARNKFQNQGRKGADCRMQTVYVGDDPIKDGGLAQNAEVDFELITENASRSNWARAAVKLGLDKAAVAEIRNGS